MKLIENQPYILKFILGLTLSVALYIAVKFAATAIIYALGDYSFEQAFMILNAPSTPNQMKLTTMVQHVSLFIVPAIVISHVLSSKSHLYLFASKPPQPQMLAAATLLIIVCLPMVNLLAEINTLVLDTVLGEENILKQSLKQYENAANKLIIANSPFELCINVVVIALTPAISEELIFRALFIRFFTKFMNAHTAIVISALLFALIHFEFYGLLPRIAFGVLFGYFFIWSKNIYIPIVAHFVNNLIIVITLNVMGEEYMQSNNFDSHTLSIVTMGLTSAIIAGYIIYKLSEKYEVYDIFRGKNPLLEKTEIKRWFNDRP